MAEVPILNPRIRSRGGRFSALGKRLSLGVMITPWFMNLMRLPGEESECWDESGRVE